MHPSYDVINLLVNEFQIQQSQFSREEARCDAIDANVEI